MTDEEQRLLQHLHDDLHALRRKQESPSARIWDVATKAAVPAVVALIAWMWATDRKVHQNSNDIKHIERDITTISGTIETGFIELREYNLQVLQRLASLEAKFPRIEGDGR